MGRTCRHPNSGKPITRLCFSGEGSHRASLHRHWRANYQAALENSCFVLEAAKSFSDSPLTPAQALVLAVVVGIVSRILRL
jgi:hypothetical protein